MADFASIIDSVSEYIEENCKERRQRATSQKKREYAELKKRMSDVRLLLVTNLISEKQATDFLKYSYGEIEINVDNSHNLRQTVGYYRKTKTKELISAEKKTIKWFVEFYKRDDNYIDTENPENNNRPDGERGPAIEYNGLQCYLVCELSEDSPCKIVTNTSTYSSLCCEV